MASIFVQGRNMKDKESAFNPFAGMDFEAIERTLTRRIPSHNHAMRTFFGESVIGEINNIVLDPDLITLDALLLSEGIDQKELSQYVRALPEHRRLRRKVIELAERITTTVIRHAIDGEMQKDTPQLRPIFRMITNVTEPYCIQGVNTLRNAIVHELRVYLAEHTTFAAHESAAETGDTIKATQVENYFRALNVAKRKRNSYFVGNVARKKLIEAKMILDRKEDGAKKKHGKVLQKELLEPRRGTQETPKDPPSEEALEALYEEIWDLGTFADPKEQYIPKSDRIALHIFPMPGSAKRRLCRVTLVLNRPAYEFVVIGRNTTNCFKNTEAGWSSIAMEIDRSTGEIYLPETKVSMRRLFEKPEDYAVLKQEIYEGLRDNLREQGMENISAAKTERERREWQAALDEEAAEQAAFEEAMEEACAETQRETAEKVTDVVDSLTKPTANDVAVTVTGDTTTRPQTDNTEKSAPSEDGNIWRRLRGIHANRIKSALDAILGKPKQRGGSHLVYYSSRTKKNYIFAFHPSRTVNLFLLREALEIWGIHPQEVFDRI